MRLPSSISAASVATLSLATLGLLVQDGLATPSPEPKAAWVRKGQGRKAISDTLKGKRDTRIAQRSKNMTSCAGAGATEITAPKANIWDQLDDVDAAGVVSWLFAQPEFNLTVSENATAWSNSV